jgi:hypothetical protein
MLLSRRTPGRCEGVLAATDTVPALGAGESLYFPVQRSFAPLRMTSLRQILNDRFLLGSEWISTLFTYPGQEIQHDGIKFL